MNANRDIIHSPPNPSLERMRSGGVALGMGIRLVRSGEIVRIAEATDHDFLFIDIQHSIFNLETLSHIAQAAQGSQVSAFVRVRSPHDPNAPVLLDAGISGVIFPDVNTRADAEHAVNASKFAPIGTRSVSGAYAVFNFERIPVGVVTKALNESTLVACMIETREALDNLEAIAAVDGIDVLHVGSNDLLLDMGKPGAFTDPSYVSAVDRVIRVAKANGKFAGVGGDPDVNRQADLIGKGVQFLTTQTDIAFLMTEASRRTGTLRNASGSPNR